MAAWLLPYFSRSLFFLLVFCREEVGQRLNAHIRAPSKSYNDEMRTWIFPSGLAIFIALNFFVFLSVMAAPALSKGRPPLVVMVDAGHGGRDRGTTQASVHEAQIVLSVAEQLQTLLSQNRQFRVIMTRTQDQTVSLNERSRLAKSHRADLFLSIHVNSSPDTKARGAEFYFQNQLPPNEESMYLAHQEEMLGTGDTKALAQYEFLQNSAYTSEVNAILRDLLDGSRIQRSSELTRALRLQWRGSRKSQSGSIRQAPFHVLSQMPVPSALVELGFLTNAQDHAALIHPNTQKQMAQDLYRGLIAFKESLDKAHQSP